MAGRIQEPVLPGPEAVLLTARATAGLAASALLAVGLLAGGVIDAVPDSLRVFVAVYGVVVGPAALLLRVTARASGADVALATAGAVFLTLSLHAVLAQAFMSAGARFSAYALVATWGLILFPAGVLGVLRVRRMSGPVARGAGAAALGVLLTLIAGAFFVRPEWTASGDAFDHVGHVRRILVMDSMRPDGVLAWPADATATVPLDPRKGALHPVIALVSDIARVDPASTWASLRVVAFPASVLAFAAFARAWVGGGRVLALALVLFLLSYSGSGVQFVNSALFGQNLAAAWYWVCAALVWRWAVTTDGGHVPWVPALLAFGGTLVHLGVAVHAAVLAATLVLFSRMLGLGARRAAIGAAWILGAAAVGASVRMGGTVPDALPNDLHAHAQGILRITDRWFVMSPMEILRQHGMVMLGGLLTVPVLALYAREMRAQRLFAMCALPMVVLFVPPVATALFDRVSYMAFRVLLNAPVLVAAAFVVAAGVRSARAGGFWKRISITTALVLWALAFVAPALRTSRADLQALGARRGGLYDDAMARAAAALPSGTTVLSDPATSYRLSALTARRVVALSQQHANPYDPYAMDRLSAVRDVLSPFALPSAAVAACRRYRVDYVMVSRRARDAGLSDYLAVWDPALFDLACRRLDSMPESFRVITDDGDFRVYRFDREGRANNAWSGVEPPVAVGAPQLAPCAPPVPGDAFRVTGIGVEPRVVAAGDTVTVTIGYRRDAMAPFDPTLLTHLRFDHESLSGTRRWPGEKYARRAEERRTGRFTRFRADVRPGHGVYETDLWPVGVELNERFRVAVPAVSAPGRYRVEMRVERETLLPNFTLDDLLYNRDHYSGTACAWIDVGARESAVTP